MFPTLSDLISYLTGLQVHLPFQTFGVVIVLSFGAAYWAYRAELLRKEKEGRISPIEKEVRQERFSPSHIFLYSLIAGLITAKGLTALTHWRSFTSHPSRILFSGVGYWITGGFVAIVTAGWLIYKRSKNIPPAKITKVVHPYQIMPSMLWWCGVTGFIGAVLFHKLEHWDKVMADPGSLLTIDGLTYYGGLLCGIAAALVIAWRHKIPLIHMVDMGSPAMMLAYGIGRIGCHLAGDGDWGISNTSPMPEALTFLPHWVWAYEYPLSNGPVFPTSLYECVICVMLFVVLWGLRRRIVTPGRLFVVYCLLNGTERLLIEQIRTNPVYAFGLTQATIIALLFIITGLIVWAFTLRTTTDHHNFTAATLTPFHK